MRRLLGVSIVLLAILACSPNPSVSVESYSLVVNYDQSLEEMIAAGNYDYVNPDITSGNFPVVAGVNGQVTVEFELVCFNQWIYPSAALDELDKRGLRPATLPELLAFGAHYPNLQRQYSITALGSVWGNWNEFRSYVPYLSEWRHSRFFGLSAYAAPYPRGCRFLAVRKS